MHLEIKLHEMSMKKSSSKVNSYEISGVKKYKVGMRLVQKNESGD